MDVIIIRPPLIYGPGVKGNFLSLIRLLSTSLPLPLGSFTFNKRSYLSLHNLLSFLLLCLTHPDASNRTFLVSDQSDISTSSLLNELALAMGSKSFIFPFPPSVIRSCLSTLGRSHIYDRLSSSFVVDSQLASRILDWTPPFSLRQGMYSCFSSFS